MRTTLTVNDEIDALLRKIATGQNRSYKDVVNEALAKGVQLIAETAPKSKYVVQPFTTAFTPAIDETKLNQMVDELEELE